MFTAIEVATGRGSLQYREENLTGFRCRISPERLKRRIDQPLYLPGESAGLPVLPGKYLFCNPDIPGRIPYTTGGKCHFSQHVPVRCLAYCNSDHEGPYGIHL